MMYNGYTKEQMITTLSGKDFFGKAPDYIVATDEVGWETAVKIGSIELGFLYVIVRSKDIICRYSRKQGVFDKSDIMASFSLSDIGEVKCDEGGLGNQTALSIVFFQSDGMVRGRWPFKQKVA